MTIAAQAAVVRKRGGPFNFETIEIDEPRSEEMVVRMIACGICHTDIAVRDGLMLSHFPCVLGHEGAGHVVETTGLSGLIKVAMEALSLRGKLSLLAISANDSDEEPPTRLGSHQKIIASVAGDSHPQTFLPYLINCYRDGLFPFDKLITQYPATDINRAIKDSLKGSTIKPLIRF